MLETEPKRPINQDKTTSHHQNAVKN